MDNRIFSLALTNLLFCAGALLAQTSVEKPLPVDGNIARNGSQVELNWFSATPPRVGAVTVKRRLYGQTGGDSWKTISPALGHAMRFNDTTIKAGVAYEYQILRSARDIVDVGYWLTGVELPAQETRGHAYLVIDETISEAVAPRLARFERDLIADGWAVHRHEVPRGDLKDLRANLVKAISVKNWLRQQYYSDPFQNHAVILIGHVPIVMSGRMNPDGHKVVPHATDLFYAEMDAQWGATLEGLLVENIVPGDFIEMQVGRIDFAALSAGNRAQELHWLRSYFDKNHHWRMGLIGDLRAAYGSNKNLISEQYGLKNIVGPNAFSVGGHHDIGEAKPWLWGVDFGDADGQRYIEQYANKAVFTINFGSLKQRFERRGNAMTALLAQPWYTIATGWGGRPAWWLHPMALGDPIGEVHKRTVNNGMALQPYRSSMDYYPTGSYMWRNPIWVNLLGDPTSRAFPLAPPTGFRAAETDQGIVLSWAASADPDVVGYKLYRATEQGKDFVELNDGLPVEALTFTDTTPAPNSHYMIRAYGLKDVYAGSFYTLSQGIFTDSGRQDADVPELEITTQPGVAVALPALFNITESGQIYAIIEGPQQGKLRHDGTNWSYTPPASFTGSLALRFSVSDAFQTQEGRLTIRIGK